MRLRADSRQRPRRHRAFRLLKAAAAVDDDVAGWNFSLASKGGPVPPGRLTTLLHSRASSAAGRKRSSRTAPSAPRNRPGHDGCAARRRGGERVVDGYACGPAALVRFTLALDPGEALSDPPGCPSPCRATGARSLRLSALPHPEPARSRATAPPLMCVSSCFLRISSTNVR